MREERVGKGKVGSEERVRERREGSVLTKGKGQGREIMWERGCEEETRLTAREERGKTGKRKVSGEQRRGMSVSEKQGDERCERLQKVMWERVCETETRLSEAKRGIAATATNMQGCLLY